MHIRTAILCVMNSNQLIEYHRYNVSKLYKKKKVNSKKGKVIWDCILGREVKKGSKI